MPCQDVVDAIAHSKQSTSSHPRDVRAFFSLHFGYLGEHPVDSVDEDRVWYATGLVTAAGAPSDHLQGTLKSVYLNAEDGSMAERPELDVKVWIHPDGRVDYQRLINGAPIGQMPPTKLQLASLADRLLTGHDGLQVVTVGVAMIPVGNVIH